MTTRDKNRSGPVIYQLAVDIEHQLTYTVVSVVYIIPFNGILFAYEDFPLLYSVKIRSMYAIYSR